MSDHKYIHEIDRTGWPSGPWDTEGNRLDFRYKDLPCLALRNSLGNWCGYVGVYPGHPAYKVHYDDVPVDVHGGLTYSDHCSGPICHEEAPGERPVWWLGMDFAHAFDLVPGMLALHRQWHPEGDTGLYRDDVYRTIGYVVDQIRSLADQLLELNPDQIKQDPEARARSNYFMEYTFRQHRLGKSFDVIRYEDAMAEYELMKTKLLEAPK